MTLTGFKEWAVCGDCDKVVSDVPMGSMWAVNNTFPICPECGSPAAYTKKVGKRVFQGSLWNPFTWMKYGVIFKEEKS